MESFAVKGGVGRSLTKYSAYEIYSKHELCFHHFLKGQQKPGADARKAWQYFLLSVRERGSGLVVSRVEQTACQGHFALPLLIMMSYSDTMKLSSKHQKTLRAIFEDSARTDIEWMAIENLFRALGAELSEGRGSRVRVYLEGVRAVFHRPHPRKETEKGALKSVRRFLTEAGVQLEE